MSLKRHWTYWGTFNSTNGRNYITSKESNVDAPLDPTQDCFPLQARSVMREGPPPEPGEEQCPLASWNSGASLLCPAPASEQRCVEEVAHVGVSAGGNTATENQKSEVNAVGGPMLSPKHSVCEHTADLLCPSPEEDACIPPGQGIALE